MATWKDFAEVDIIMLYVRYGYARKAERDGWPFALEDAIQKFFWSIFDSLPGRLRYVLDLRYLQRLEIVEIAEICGKSETWVKNRVFLALKIFEEKTAKARGKQGELHI